ncbi:DUF5342 family protein [Bacillus sp. N9]
MENFEVKPLFKNQIHERQQFSLDIEGHTYQGIYHDEEIQWFHPHPKNVLEDKVLENMESIVSDLMTNKLEH